MSKLSEKLFEVDSDLEDDEDDEEEEEDVGKNEEKNDKVQALGEICDRVEELFRNNEELKWGSGNAQTK